MAKTTKRPMTQKEIREQKRPSQSPETITILNVSKQLVILHSRPKNSKDFYGSARDIQLRPGKMITVPKNRTWESQIARLSGRRLISIINDSEKTRKPAQAGKKSNPIIVVEK